MKCIKLNSKFEGEYISPSSGKVYPFTVDHGISGWYLWMHGESQRIIFTDLNLNRSNVLTLCGINDIGGGFPYCPTYDDLIKLLNTIEKVHRFKSGKVRLIEKLYLIIPNRIIRKYFDIKMPGKKRKFKLNYSI